ncbi:MAG TPA: hypothetical protein VGQ59_17330 [Cyclobacteriaceae bacterium]|jgi:hypothetical protein|nr:hypothetical protein [Cyclobacteriaceae bacterium]
MKKLSHKDLIIALGIAVAAIILVSSIYFTDPGKKERSSTKPVPTGKAKPTVLIKKVLEKLASKAHL